MTRSKFRRAIRQTIQTRLNAMDDLDIRELVVSLTDTLIDWHGENGCVEDVDSCFADILAGLKESKLEPEAIGDEIFAADRQKSQN